ncbi:MAG TPA: O-antigen ligase family protein [Candidatus Kaiserbacteria bacterium]|nr:O-antigen ligase family protein [Candidatus Kaiserbacteria bacterium]
MTDVKKIALWVTLAGLFLVPFTPIIVLNGFFFPFITGKAFFFRIAVEIAFAGWAVLAFADKRYRPRWSFISIALIAFVAWMFVADAFAVNPAKAFWSNFERMEGWVTLLHLLMFFVVSSTVLRVEKKWRAWWYTSVAVASYIIVYGLLQLAGVAAIHQGSVRVDASLGNAAYLAVYMLFNVFVSSWLALTTKRRWLRYFLFTIAIFSAWILFATATRGTILGLGGGLFISAVLALFTMGKRVRGFAGGAVLLIVLVAGGFWLAKDTGVIRHDPVLGRIASISLAQGQTRFEIWHIALDGVTESPKTVLVGWGQEGFNYVFNKYYNPSLYKQEQWFDRAHNAFIDWLVAGGVPAFLLYISLFISALWVLWKEPFSRAEQIAFTALLAGYAFHNLFVFDNITSYIVFIALLSLIDSGANKPIKKFENAREVSPENLKSIVAPVVGAVFVGVILLVDMPGINASRGLIKALTPQKTFAQNIQAWRYEVAHPAFASQEVREQLLSYAMQIVHDPRVSLANKREIATLAISEMQKEVAELPQDARIRFELAVGYASFGNYKEALKQISTAIALSPKKETMILEEGVIRLQSGDKAGAAKAFKKAYMLAPHFRGLVSYGAAGYILSGDMRSAEALLMKTFGTTTVDRPALIEAYAYSKKYAPLIDIYSARVAKQGSSVEDSFRLAVAEAAYGRIHTAVARIRTTIASHPEAKAVGNTLIKQIESGKIR